MTTIRPATVDDVPAIVRMAQAFSAAGPFTVETDPVKVERLAESFLAGAGGLFVADRDGVVVGMIAMHVYEHPFAALRVASELVWWVDEAARGGTTGLRLLEAGEAWASEVGAARIYMIAPDDTVAKLYERRGYALMERVYERRV